MDKIAIRLDDYVAIRDFLKIVSMFTSDVNLSNLRCECDAKSLISVMNLDVSDGVYVWINAKTDDEKIRFSNAMEKFKVNKEGLK